jgi:hypothetical protein
MYVWYIRYINISKTYLYVYINIYIYMIYQSLSIRQQWELNYLHLESFYLYALKLYKSFWISLMLLTEWQPAHHWNQVNCQTPFKPKRLRENPRIFPDSCHIDTPKLSTTVRIKKWFSVKFSPWREWRSVMIPTWWYAGIKIIASSCQSWDVPSR